MCAPALSALVSSPCLSIFPSGHGLVGACGDPSPACHRVCQPHGLQGFAKSTRACGLLVYKKKILPDVFIDLSAQGREPEAERCAQDAQCFTARVSAIAISLRQKSSEPTEPHPSSCEFKWIHIWLWLSKPIGSHFGFG